MPALADYYHNCSYGQAELDFNVTAVDVCLELHVGGEGAGGRAGGG